MATSTCQLNYLKFCRQRMSDVLQQHNLLLPNLFPPFHVTQQQIFWCRRLFLILINNKQAAKAVFQQSYLTPADHCHHVACGFAYVIQPKPLQC